MPSEPKSSRKKSAKTSAIQSDQLALFLNAPETKAVLDITVESSPVEVASERTIWTVTELTQRLREVVEDDPVLGGTFTVSGELSNIKPSSRGHVYFTLKDETASISGVIWASLAQKIPFRLEEGMAVYATGTFNLYAPNGSYSVVIKRLEPIGMGPLQLAFQQLKEKLEQEGLFKPEFKQAIPVFPERLGIVTAKTGAVIHDMLRVLRRKNPLLNVLIAPVKVQGDGAAEEIAAAIKRLNLPELALDLIIVARGGGSYEDLFCFSEEPVVRAIFESKVPVVTGIGHEPDFSLADAAADYSAATPTAAAELIPDTGQLKQLMDAIAVELVERIQQQIMQAEQQLDQLASQLIDRHALWWQSQSHQLQQMQQSLIQAMSLCLERTQGQLQQMAKELQLFSPLETLARGYAVLLDESEKTVIHHVDAVKPGQTIWLKLQDGKIQSEVKAIYGES